MSLPFFSMFESPIECKKGGKVNIDQEYVSRNTKYSQQMNFDQMIGSVAIDDD